MATFFIVGEYIFFEMSLQTLAGVVPHLLPHPHFPQLYHIPAASGGKMNKNGTPLSNIESRLPWD